MTDDGENQDKIRILYTQHQTIRRVYLLAALTLYLCLRSVNISSSQGDTPRISLCIRSRTFHWSAFCLVGFLTSSSATRLYCGRVPKLTSDNFYVLAHARQSGKTNINEMNYVRQIVCLFYVSFVLLKM